MKEIWKSIKEYNGIYQVSNKGKVRSWKNNKWGKSNKPKILTPVKNKIKYPTINLCKDGKCKRFYIHRLVAEAFIPNPENKPQVNHKDLNRTNNCVENLEWSTQKENMKHAYNNGTHEVPGLKGEDHSNSKLTDEKVILIRNQYNKGNVSQRKLANKYNVNQTTIWSILNKKTWNHV